MKNTVADAFLRTVTEHGDVPALRWQQDKQWNEITWAQVAARVARFAGGLQAKGVQPGDNVAIVLGNRPEFHIADLAVLFCGATPVSLYTSSTEAQIVELTERLGARVVIAEENVGEFDGDPMDLAAAAESIDVDGLATIIFTSGTTSKPKGVMLSHANVMSLVESVRATTKVDLVGKRVISYLPLAHIAERALSHYLPVATAMTVTTCPNPTLLSTYLPATRPHLFFGVPQVWDKLRLGAQHQMKKRPVQAKFVDAVIIGGPVAHRLGSRVLQRLRAQLGLDEVIFAASGAAPLSVETATWFKNIDVPFAEIYGMSETTGPITWSPEGHAPGTVGHAMPGVELRLLPDGEVIVRGKTVFSGYLDDPDATKSALHDGWLCTGDIGEFAADGCLRIVDRKKDLIVTSGGKNVSPAALETKLCEHDDIDHACIVGDRRAFISAIIVTRRGANTDAIQQHIASVNKGFSRAERIKRYEIVTDEWKTDSDLLTPTMKVRRRGVEAQYSAIIESFYDRNAQRVA